MKKSAILHLVLIFFILTIPVKAQNVSKTFTSGNWSYMRNNDGWTITRYTGNENEIVIPADFNDIPVTQLAAELFRDNISLVSIIIPDSVLTIGKNIFFGCSHLESVILPNALKTIPEGCFRYCLSMENIELPYSLTSLGKEAFSDCIRLKEILIPANVTTIGESAFAYCTDLAEISVPKKTTTINANAFLDTAWMNAQQDEFVFIGRGILLKYNGTAETVEIPYGTVSISNAFQGNMRIRSVILPETMLRITQNAFRDAAYLESINIPDSVTTIGASAFEGCRSLKRIDLPESITSLGGSAFRYCDKLTELEIPSKIKNVPARVGGDCLNLINVWIPDGVTAIDVNAFAGSDQVQLQIASGSPAEAILTEREISYISYDPSNEEYTYTVTENGVEIIKYIGQRYDVIIPAEIADRPVITIRESAFRGNKQIRSVRMPLTLKHIEDQAFAEMKNLESVQFSFGLEDLGGNIFTGSPNILEVSFPEGIKSIGNNIFDKNTRTKICAVTGSDAEHLLTEYGYRVSPPEKCSRINDTLDKWSESSLQSDSACNCTDCPKPIN